jgi:uncharacterized protein (TIGR02145 family)
MKMYFTLFALTFFCLANMTLSAQDNLNVLLKNRMDFNIQLQQLDSITFDNSVALRIEFHYGIQFDTISLHRVDTLSLNTDTLQADEPMDAEFEEALQALDQPSILLSEVFFDDGQSVQDFLELNNPEWLTDPPYLRSLVTDFSDKSASVQKKHLLANMFESANRLVTDDLNPSNGPETSGLAYVWGGKSAEVKTVPKKPEFLSAPTYENICSNNIIKTACAPDCGCDDQLLYGLDCSGFVTTVALQAGIKFPEPYPGCNDVRFCLNANALSDTSHWNRGLVSPQSYKYNKIIYKPLSNIGPGQLRMGDIVIKNNKQHIGIISNIIAGGDSIIMYQSNGQNYRCPKNTDGTLGSGCLDNNVTTRGPRTVSIASANFTALFGSNFLVLRLDTISGCPGGIISVTDLDNNVYPVIQIGNQCWTKENLRTTKYSNGATIPNTILNNTWSTLTTAAWAHVNNDAATEILYGKLYNGYAVTTNVCPAGWHVPTTEEWTALELELGLDPADVSLTSDRGAAVNVGGQLKSASTLWASPNLGATNETGFSAEPAGNRASINGTFGNLGGIAYFWSSTTGSTSDRLLNRVLNTNSQGVSVGDAVKRNGFSIRCVKNP